MLTCIGSVGSFAALARINFVYFAIIDACNLVILDVNALLEFLHMLAFVVYIFGWTIVL